MTTVPREWQELQFLDPEKILVGLRQIALTYPLHELSYRVASLRTRQLRIYGEGRQAALFCYGMGQMLGVKLSFALAEARDHDVVARFQANDKINYVPIQLKEFVPGNVNQTVTLQQELDKLGKYADAQDLTIAVHLNRSEYLRLSELSFPHGKLGELWFYGCLEPCQRRWIVMGNLLSPNAKYCEFLYPEA